jgi:hypothetical protein
MSYIPRWQGRKAQASAEAMFLAVHMQLWLWNFNKLKEKPAVYSSEYPIFAVCL